MNNCRVGTIGTFIRKIYTLLLGVQLADESEIYNSPILSCNKSIGCDSRVGIFFENSSLSFEFLRCKGS